MVYNDTYATRLGSFIMRADVDQGCGPGTQSGCGTVCYNKADL